MLLLFGNTGREVKLPKRHFASICMPKEEKKYRESPSMGVGVRVGARLNGESYFLCWFDWQFISI